MQNTALGKSLEEKNEMAFLYTCPSVNMGGTGV
jgi:hypothetical protein